MNSIESARLRSEAGIDAVRQIASRIFGDEAGLIIGTNGSYARREATSGSDIDLFYLLEGDARLDPSKRYRFEEQLKAYSLKLPSEGGVFELPLRTEELLKNIGGLDDTNTSLTRRMLLLLEGEWLTSKELFQNTRRSLLSRYVADTTPDNKIALFLLNDIIRYWRTLCVDYEYKTGNGRKPRGIRLVKLRFSRMFLVFGGILAVAETLNLTARQKISKLEYLFSLDVISRVGEILGEQAKTVLSLYDNFLLSLDDEEIRAKLSSESYADASEFTALRTKGREFKEQLLNSLSSKYPAGHQIHRALLL